MKQGAIIASHGSLFGPADTAARAFIAQGWSRSPIARKSGQPAARAKAAGLLAPDRGHMVASLAETR